MALRIRVRAPVKPTEDAEKVRAAILALFPGATCVETPSGIEAEARDFARVRELIRSQRIQDTARGVMMTGLIESGLRSHFLLGKQAAAAGRAHFGVVRSPLGDLEVMFEGDDPDEVSRFIYQVAPDTTVAPEWAEVPAYLRPAPE